MCGRRHREQPRVAQHGGEDAHGDKRHLRGERGERCERREASGGSAAYESALGVGHIVQLPGDVDLPRVQPAVVVRICTGWDETNATRVVSRRRLTHSPTN